MTDKTLHWLLDRFQKHPFSIPSPGSGRDLCKHADAIDTLLKTCDDPEIKRELAAYQYLLLAVAKRLALLMALPIATLAAYVHQDRSEATTGKG